MSNQKPNQTPETSKSTPKPPHVFNNPSVTDKRNPRPSETKVVKK